MPIRYGQLIKDAFAIARGHRYLWLFGFFGGGLSGSNLNFNPGGWFDGGGSGDLDGALFDDTALLVGLLVALAVLILAFGFLAVLSQAALVDSVVAIEGGERRSFATAWRAGLRSFWRVLGLVLLLVLVSLGLLIAIGGPVALVVLGTLGATESTVARVLVIGLFAFLGIAALIVAFVAFGIVAQLALRELIVGGGRVLAALPAAYRLFRRRLGPALVVWLIQLGLTIAAVLALVIAALVLGLVLFLPAIVLGLTGYTTAAIVAGVVAGLVLVPALLVAGGALGTFNHAYWTLAYLRLSADPVPPPGPVEPALPGR